jgi:hypothetical protein
VVNRFVQFQDCVCIFGALEGQRFALRELPVLIDCDDKFVESILPVSDGFPNPVLYQPALQVIVFFAGGGSFIPAESWSTQRNSWRFSQALLREDLDASSSSSTFCSFCGVIPLSVQENTIRVKLQAARPVPAESMGKVRYELIPFSNSTSFGEPTVGHQGRLYSGPEANWAPSGAATDIDCKMQVSL